MNHRIILEKFDIQIYTITKWFDYEIVYNLDISDTFNYNKEYQCTHLQVYALNTIYYNYGKYAKLRGSNYMFKLFRAYHEINFSKRLCDNKDIYLLKRFNYSENIYSFTNIIKEKDITNQRVKIIYKPLKILHVQYIGHICDDYFYKSIYPNKRIYNFYQNYIPVPNNYFEKLDDFKTILNYNTRIIENQKEQKYYINMMYKKSPYHLKQIKMFKKYKMINKDIKNIIVSFLII